MFEVDPQPLEESLTALGGIPLVVQAFRSLGLPGSVQQHVAVKERERGYDEATFVESLVILNAAGVECVDDFAHLRNDRGLAELIGHELPSPEAARKFLNAFHEEEEIEEAHQRRLPDSTAYIPEENRALEGLERVNRDLIQRLGERCADQKIFTVDQDATIIESRKREALYTYEGSRGYQPMLAVWAEMDVVLADEFRDGNVPAQMAPLTVAQAAFAAAPTTVTSYYYRGDSACHENKLLRCVGSINLNAELTQGTDEMHTVNPPTMAASGKESAPAEVSRSSSQNSAGWIGVYVQTGTYGTLVTNVTANGPGAKAGMQVGDLILALDGRLIKGKNFEAAVAALKPGTQITVNYTRGSSAHETRVTVGSDGM